MTSLFFKLTFTHLFVWEYEPDQDYDSRTDYPPGEPVRFIAGPHTTVVYHWSTGKVMTYTHL